MRSAHGGYSNASTLPGQKRACFPPIVAHQLATKNLTFHYLWMLGSLLSLFHCICIICTALMLWWRQRRLRMMNYDGSIAGGGLWLTSLCSGWAWPASLSLCSSSSRTWGWAYHACSALCYCGRDRGRDSGCRGWGTTRLSDMPLAILM